MPLVDYERAYLEVRSQILGKNSWGKRELILLLAEIEDANRVPEGERDFADGPVPHHPQATRSQDSRVGVV